MTIPPVPTLTLERRPGWRAACLAYREQRRAGASDVEAYRAALAALQAVWRLPENEARVEVAQAIAYAGKWHADWLWSAAR
jgi:hypothetical protein